MDEKRIEGARMPTRENQQGKVINGNRQSDEICCNP